ELLGAIERGVAARLHVPVEANRRMAEVAEPRRGLHRCSTTFATGLRISRLAISAPPRGDRPAHLPARGPVARGWAVGGRRVKSLGRPLGRPWEGVAVGPDDGHGSLAR